MDVCFLRLIWNNIPSTNHARNATPPLFDSAGFYYELLPDWLRNNKLIKNKFVTPFPLTQKTAYFTQKIIGTQELKCCASLSAQTRSRTCIPVTWPRKINLRWQKTSLSTGNNLAYPFMQRKDWNKLKWCILHFGHQKTEKLEHNVTKIGKYNILSREHCVPFAWIFRVLHQGQSFSLD